ncbi:MAG: autotransporter outer membrane beta-barrel domain-containing protein, partial [Alphaproteobacteria bacterium]
TTAGNFDVSTVTVSGGNTLSITPGDTVQMNTMPVSAGTFEFGVTDAATHGFVSVTAGGVSLTAGQITVNVIGNGIVAGDTLMIADGTAPDVIASTAVVDNSILFDFRVEDGGQAALSDNTDLWLRVSLNAAITGALTPGDNNVLTTLLGLTPGELASQGGELQLILDNVNAAATPGELHDILSAAQPDVSGGAFYGVQNFVETILDITEDELNNPQGLRGTARLMYRDGKASGNESMGLRAWGQIFGQTAQQGTRDGIEGFDAKTAGFAMGIDTDDGYEDSRVGIGVAYGRTAVDADNSASGETDINSYQLSLYGNYNLNNDTFLRAFAAYAHNTDETVRHNVGGVPGLTAHGDYDADEVTLLAKAGHAFHSDGSMTFTPTALARWSYYSPDSYTETGAGAANLNVVQDNMNIVELGLGGEVKWEIHGAQGYITTPSLHAGYRYDLVGDRIETTSTFTGGGAAFTSPGADPARSRFNAGADLKFYTTGTWQFKAAYDFDYKQDYYAHSGVLRAAVKF